MHKLFSARMDEYYIHLISQLAGRLKTSKKNVLEKAVAMLWSKQNQGDATHFMADAFGVWKDKTEPLETISADIKNKFTSSYHRHHQS